jgi:hypothetical protein
MVPETSRPWVVWQANWSGTLAFLWRPIHLTTCSQSLSSAVILPLPLLLLAIAGLGGAMRRRTTWFLLIAFTLGLLPTLFGPNGVSSRRLLPAAMIVPFFIGMAVDGVPKRWRGLAAASITAGVLLWGPLTYFSPQFWTARDKMAFCDVDCSLAGKENPRRLPTGCLEAARVVGRHR